MKELALLRAEERVSLNEHVLELVRTGETQAYDSLYAAKEYIANSGRNDLEIKYVEKSYVPIVMNPEEEVALVLPIMLDLGLDLNKSRLKNFPPNENSSILTQPPSPPIPQLDLKCLSKSSRQKCY